MEVDKFKEIFDNHPELNELLKTKELLKNKRSKTKKERKQLTSVCKKLEKVFKKVETELYKFPQNIPLAMLTVKGLGIDVCNYELNKDCLLMYIDKFGNIWENLGKLINIFYNHILSKNDNGLNRIRIFFKDVNLDSKILTMSVTNICDFMTGRIPVNVFAERCSVI